MVLITIVTGAYKPTYNWGASHCTTLKNMLVSSDDDIPNIWKAIRFHGSKPPTRICISYLVSVSDTDLISLAHESWHPASSCQLKVAEYCYPYFLVIGDVSMSVDILTSAVQIFKACHCQWSPPCLKQPGKWKATIQTTDDNHSRKFNLTIIPS